MNNLEARLTMTITIRQERESDYTSVSNIIQSAFEDEIHTNHKEHFLVEQLRKGSAFIPELSLVAEANAEVLGHILFSSVIIKGEDDKGIQSLALAPLSVAPAFQRLGIGSELVRRGHERAKSLGYQSVVVLGHNSYYSRFGYVPAERYNIHLPFEAPRENFMALELEAGALHTVAGVVVYPEEFYA